jgi:hypothetical protein
MAILHWPRAVLGCHETQSIFMLPAKVPRALMSKTKLFMGNG